MQFSKLPLSIADQVQLLESRGMLVPNKNSAEQVLSNISYYRLRAYMMSFQNPVDPSHTFTPGTTFNQVIDLYSFDRELRLLVFDATERIEIALRTQIIYQFSLQDGAWWFEDSSLYINNYIYSRNLAKLDEELDRSQELFIGHYKNKYTSPQRPPAWMSLEVTSMGLLSKLYRELKLSPAKKAVARHFGLGHPKVLESWMQSFSYVRNICAHHSRLFNRVLTVKPTYPTHTANTWLNDMNFHHAKVYGLLSCAVYLLKTIQPDTAIPARLKELLIKYPQIKPYQLGMSADWENEQLWK